MTDNYRGPGKQFRKDPLATHERQEAVIEEYRICGNLRMACERAEVSTTSHYRWLETDASYRQVWEVAKEDAADLLEAEAWRRAVEGVRKPVGPWKDGAPAGYVQEYSDRLLLALLKGLRPGKYAERRVTVRSSFSERDLQEIVQRLPDEAVARIAAGEDPSVVLGTLSEPVLRRLLGPGDAPTGPEGEPAQDARVQDARVVASRSEDASPPTSGSSSPEASGGPQAPEDAPSPPTSGSGHDGAPAGPGDAEGGSGEAGGDDDAGLFEL